jgi:hypothetical protein
VRCLGVICGVQRAVILIHLPLLQPLGLPCVITPSSSASFTSSSLSPSCSSGRGLAPTPPPLHDLPLAHCVFRIRQTAMCVCAAKVGAHKFRRACCCLLKLPQLYAGCLYIHSNLTDRLGNAAPVPHLFLLQVRQSPCILPEIPDANAECIVHDISGSHAHAVRSPPFSPHSSSSSFQTPCHSMWQPRPFASAPLSPKKQL